MADFAAILGAAAFHITILFIIPPLGLPKTDSSNTGYFLFDKIGISTDFISSIDLSLFFIYPKKAVCFERTEYLQETWTIESLFS